MVLAGRPARLDGSFFPMNRVVVTVASLALNVGLSVAVVILVAARPSRVAHSEMLRSPDLLRRTAAAMPSWSQWKSRDAKGVVESLRTAGFPADVVRAIVVSLVNDAFRARRAALSAEATTSQYWEPGFGYLPARIVSRAAAIDKEEQAVLRGLLGPEPEGDRPFGIAALRNHDHGVPPEKFGRIQAVLSDYGDLAAAILTGTNGVLLRSDTEQLDLLEKEKNRDLDTVLSPDERFEYDLRNSPLADSLRYALKAFHPTEAEFRAIYRARQSSAQSAGTSGSGAPGPDTESAGMTEIEQQLGSTRFAEFRRVSDPSYVSTYSLVERLNLPPEAAARVWDLKAGYVAQADAVRNNPALSAEERRQQLTSLSADASAKVQTVLGQPGLNAYQRGAGAWLGTLSAGSP